MINVVVSCGNQIMFYVNLNFKIGLVIGKEKKIVESNLLFLIILYHIEFPGCFLISLEGFRYVTLIKDIYYLITFDFPEVQSSRTVRSDR